MLLGILQFLGGIGFFLFGLNYMEQAVSGFSTGGFKNFMKNFTSSTSKSFISGILITTILQSSNVMSVLVLAFVGTGILSLTSALAVILGTNIGTMIPTSILGMVGLSLDVSIIAFILIFFGAIFVNFLTHWSKVEALGKFLLSLGLIFLAFSFMKDGLNFLTDIDLSLFNGMSPWLFFLFGLALTLLVQSGSITFVIVLAVSSAGILLPELALPIIFGGYVGSTVTIIIGALGKNSLAIKKQVALRHVGFNLVTALAGMFCLPLIIKFYMSVLAQNVSIVVGFVILWVGWRSVFAMMFLPLVKPASEMLTKFIKDSKQNIQLATHKIIDVENLDPSVIQLAVKQDMFLLFWKAIKYNLNVWDFSAISMHDGATTEEELAMTLSLKGSFSNNELSKSYRDVKSIQNSLLEFIVSLPVSEKSQENAELYQSLLLILDSCKAIKDVWNNIEDWQWSSSEKLQKDYESTREMVIRFYSSILHLYQRFDSKKAMSDAQEILEILNNENDEYLAQLRPHKNDDIPLTTLIQVRRYLVQSNKDLLHAMELFKVGPDDVKYFKENMAYFMK